MTGPFRPRRLAALSIGGVVVGLVVLLLAFSSIGSFASPGPTPTSTDWEVGAGLAKMGAVQRVSGQAYWDTFCPPDTGYCMAPAGLAYVPSAQLVLLTEITSFELGGQWGGINATLEFSTSTLELTAPARLNCSPLVPFYPGIGVDVYVPCWNSTVTLLAIDVQTQSVVASMTPLLNLYGNSMAYDPTDGLIYWGTAQNDLVSVDPVNNTIVGIIPVEGASIPAGEWLSSSYGLSYDPATNALLMPSSSDDLLAVNPESGATEQVIPLAGPADSLTADAATNQLFVSTSDINTATSSVEVFNAATYAREETLPIPNCVYNICAEPNDVNQVLLDPAHGDAYLVATTGLFAVNLTTLSMSTVMADYGDGAQETGVYIPSLDAIFGTYAPSVIGPGYVATLHHATSSFLSTLLWMPASVALLLLAGVTGVLLAVISPVEIPPEDLEMYATLWTSADDDLGRPNS
ncbi:MAG TPA: hypothetical protein VMH38_08995 [Thermoplasmata archaeon]|nr:hypothetical protein [Thermoplasmata archaeon]